MDEEVCDKCKTAKDSMRELNRELAVSTSLYAELIERVRKMGKSIRKIKTKINNLENGKE